MRPEHPVVARIRAALDVADPGVLAALDDLTGLAETRDAGRLLARLPVERIAPPEHTPRPLRVAVVGTFTAENVAPLLHVELLRSGIAPTVLVTGFDQLMVQLTDPDSELTRFCPDVTLCLLHDGALLPADWDPTELDEVLRVAGGRLTMLGQAVAAFGARSAGAVVLHTVALPRAQRNKVVGFAERARLGVLWRDLNSRLLGFADRSVHVLDLEAQLTDHPAALRDERLNRFASMAWTPGVEQTYVREAAAFCRAFVGAARKLVVVDLDNTLWGGVLGDDGATGIQVGGGYPGNCYSELQRALVALRRQGVLLAVCSKNEQTLVDEVLAGHPDLVVRPADFVATVANWGRKDENIRQIVRTLNIGMDSVVFVDDSPFECDLVRRELPAVRVVHLAGDPAEHAMAVLEPGFFATLATTDTDRDRTAMYQARAQREEFAAALASPHDYLSGLGLRVTVAPADEFSLPRLVQLGLRTNQFNLNPRAHSESVTREYAESPEHLLLGVEVEDRFGREGLVAAVWVATGPACWTVENMVMSCRVFSRGVEHAVLARLADLASSAGVPTLHAWYRPGERNKAAAGLLKSFTLLEENDGVSRYGVAVADVPTAPDWIELNGAVHV
jgi:FkbH-like protein